MFAAPKRAWMWFVGGVTEASLACADRLNRRPTFTLEIADGRARLSSPRVDPIADIARGETGAGLPPRIAERMRRAALDIVVPPAWVFRCGLNPVATASVRYLDAFVRHQIDKITPWRAADVYYQVLQAPLSGDPARISIEVAVVPRRLVDADVMAFTALGTKPIRLVSPATEGSASIRISVAEDAGDRAARLRRPITLALGAMALSVVATIGLASWNASLVRAEIDELDARMAERKSIVAEAARRKHAGSAAAQALPALRAARPRTVDIIEALSGALPDTAYLSELTVERDRLRLSGVTTNPSILVPTLETSGYFSSVASFEATTRLEAGQGDRFHLEMRAKDPGRAKKVR